jgi:hypothetical protein
MVAIFGSFKFAISNSSLMKISPQSTTFDSIAAFVAILLFNALFWACVPIENVVNKVVRNRCSFRVNIM